jgi:Na+/H+ antiporter NhaC
MNFGELFYNYIPLIVSNLIVIVFFIFFKKNKEKESQLHKDEVSKLEAQALLPLNMLPLFTMMFLLPQRYI